MLLSNEVSKEEKLTILEDEFKISPTRDFEEGVNVMCNLSEGIERKGIEKGLEKGLEKGIEKGIKKGIEKGIEKGLEKGREEGIQALVETLNEISVPEKTIVEKVIEKYGISQENAEAAVKKYGKQ